MVIQSILKIKEWKIGWRKTKKTLTTWLTEQIMKAVWTTEVEKGRWRSVVTLGNVRSKRPRITQGGTPTNLTSFDRKHTLFKTKRQKPPWHFLNIHYSELALTIKKTCIQSPSERHRERSGKNTLPFHVTKIYEPPLKNAC